MITERDFADRIEAIASGIEDALADSNGRLDVPGLDRMSFLLGARTVLNTFREVSKK